MQWNSCTYNGPVALPRVTKLIGNDNNNNGVQTMIPLMQQ